MWYLLLEFVGADQHHSSYQRPVTDDELTSPITRTIDKSFSRFAEEVQSDKSNRGSSYHYIYSMLPTPSLIMSKLGRRREVGGSAASPSELTLRCRQVLISC